MTFVKNSFFLFFFVGLIFSESWVLNYKGKVFYEKDFYNYFSKEDWFLIKDKDKRASLFFDFIKRSASVYESQLLGLDFSFSVAEKLNGRFERLLVNEYYMRDFLLSVTPKTGLAFCQKNLKKEVFVNHILVEKDSLAVALLDSLRFGASFSRLASSFSMDPSVKNNFGVLGWLGVGETVPGFQDGVFSLCVGCFDYIKTNFGFHVIRVDSVRASKASLLKKEEYNDRAFRFATAYIVEPLVDLASRHDSSLLKDAGVVFDFVVLADFVGIIKESLLKNKRREDVDFVGLLAEVSEPLVKYNGSFLSGKWFANKFSNLFYKNPFFDSVGPFEKELRLILLRDFVFNLSLEKGLHKNVFFKKQFKSIKGAVLEKEFMKHLTQSVSLPLKGEVEDYYFVNEKSLFTNKKTGKPFGLSSSYASIEAILLKEKQDNERKLFFNSLSGSSVKINEGWLNGF